MTTPITIRQVAEAAGVSPATVDRVLNNRPGVNAQTVERVREAMQQLGAVKPIRGRPRSVSNYRFGFVLPDARRGFFDMVDRQIAQLAGEFRHQHITEITHRFPAGDPAVFADELRKLGNLDGLAVLAPDSSAVRLAINELVRSGVHVVTIFSDVPGCMRETFVGADNRVAGRTAALLIGNTLQFSAAACLMLQPLSRFSAEHDRAQGFTQVMQERFPGIQVHHCIDFPESETLAQETSLRLLAESQASGPLHAIYNIGPGSIGLVKAIEQMGLRCVSVSHHLHEPHRMLLMKGALTYVLHQDVHYAVLTAARALKALSEGIRGALAVATPNVEILTTENLS